MKQNNINEERIVLIQEIIQFVLFLCLLICSVFLSIKLKETKEEDDHQVEGNEDEYADKVLQILNESKFSNDMNDKLKKELNEKTVEAFFHKYQFVSLSTCRTGEGQEKRLLVIGCREKE